MIVFLNGELVSEEKALVSVFDRCFLYGDGLFETIRVYNSRPFRWRPHLERLQRGAAFLKMRLPFPAPALAAHAARLIQENRMAAALLRITLSRGIGPRGYSIRCADKPSLVMTLHPAPDTDSSERPQWRLMTSSLRVPANDPVALFKTCNKLHQILARTEAETAGMDEALLLNTDGQVAEAASSSLFWVEDEVVCTTPLANGILAGVTRAVVLELCAKLGLRSKEATTTPDRLQMVQGVFLALSSFGIVNVRTLDRHALAQSPLVERIDEAYQHLIAQETSEPV
jgi:branched-chain amino acid aminotransferase